MKNAAERWRLRAGALTFGGLVMVAGCGAARPPEPSETGGDAQGEHALPEAGRLPPARQIHVKTPDGLSIAVQEWGHPEGPEVLFVHGLSQSHLAWAPQIQSRLADDFRIITYDLRGHGVSDKPIEAKYYEEDRRWGDELRAVIEGAGLKRPVVVGWSLGGVVILDYLRAYGDAALGGVVFVDAVTRLDRALLGEMPPLTSEDLPTRLGAMRQFLRDCFVVPPPPAAFETMLAYNAMVPASVQAAVGHIPLDGADEALRALSVPALVIHGAEDRHAKVAMATRTASLVRGARLSLYEGVGHAPFYEARERFNAELANFLREVNGAAPGPMPRP
ncbi:alpha/beta fold hydrolase [Polyangium sorediatum]|uniref:Alpha/beta hydrolase n=1 Tax=Polyangium sorediatum TaxID=889274 RepID=A0ABT6P2Q4_9BACT|nr:alpha/beta hydrolase [Polyangium sorediatum]MDI1434806.1 alpha/beta hydrolase [Polyangium sorediatum]